MTTSVRHVDRGAWLSVDGTREIGVSGLWQFTGGEFCDCEVTDFLAEGFVEIGVDQACIDALLGGRCIRCGTEGTSDWVTLGRVVGTDEKNFYAVDPDVIQTTGET